MNQNPAEGAIMGDKEEIKANVLEKVVSEKNASAGHMTGAKDLLSAMSAVNNQDATPETKKPPKTRWQQIFIACCCMLAIAVFLYLDLKINAVAKDINTLKARVTAPDTREQFAAVTAEMKDLKATNAQLHAELKKVRDTLETLKSKKENVAPVQRKRR
jgi:septal ring factor EnvC (AmiA/AmiB activator)